MALRKKGIRETECLFRVIIPVSSLLTDLDKASIVSDFKNVVDTFVRPLLVYQEPTHTVIVSDPNFNPLVAFNQNNTQITNTPVINTISGRILYDKNQEWSYLRPYPGRGTAEGQIKVKDAVIRSVRMKVDVSGYNLIKTSKKVEIDGYLFDTESIARPHGLFGAEYYTFYFVRSL
jgi:hypothetical protein